MKIINLMENLKGEKNCVVEHGLSFYVETDNHKILVDTGASDAFLTNAKELGVDLTQVDIVILSHGHYDHSGGIIPFTKINNHAKIYMQKTAIKEYYHIYPDDTCYIGIDPRIKQLNQLILVDGNLTIDDELSLFSNIKGRKYWPEGNLHLKRKEETANSVEYLQDEFDHEQCLVIKEGNDIVLMSGCAHNGILNIMDEYYRLYQSYPTAAISGFHMMKKTPHTEEEVEVIKKTAEELLKCGTNFYTGHCTGQPALDIMKEIMKDKLCQVYCGDEVRL